MAAAPRVIAFTVDVHLRFTTGSGQRGENVHQYHYGSIPTAADLLALATQFWANVGPTWRLMMGNDVIPQEIYVADLDASHSMAAATLPLGVGHNGTRGTDEEPGSAAAQMTIRSALRGRHYRGRKSLSGFDSQDQTKDTFGNQLLTWLATYAAKLLLDIIIGGITFIPAVGSPALHLSTPINSAFMPDPFVGSQKTRLPEHGSF